MAGLKSEARRNTLVTSRYGGQFTSSAGTRDRKAAETATSRMKRPMVGRAEAGAISGRNGSASGGRIVAGPSSADELGSVRNPPGDPRGGPERSAAVGL